MRLLRTVCTTSTKQRHNTPPRRDTMNFGSEFTLHDSDDETEEVREDAAPRGGPLSSMALSPEEGASADDSDDAFDAVGIGARAGYGGGGESHSRAAVPSPQHDPSRGLAFQLGSDGRGGGRGYGKRHEPRVASTSTAPVFRARAAVSGGDGITSASGSTRAQLLSVPTTRVPRRWTHKVGGVSVLLKLFDENIFGVVWVVGVDSNT